MRGLLLLGPALPRLAACDDGHRRGDDDRWYRTSGRRGPRDHRPGWDDRYHGFSRNRMNRARFVRNAGDQRACR